MKSFTQVSPRVKSQRAKGNGVVCKYLTNKNLFNISVVVGKSGVESSGGSEIFSNIETRDPQSPDELSTLSK